MFRWLTKWIFGNQPQQIFHPKERMIYQYWDGQKVVAVDPLIIYRRFAEVQPQLVIDRKVATSLSKDAPKAWPAMIAKIHTIFEIKGMSEGGLTEAETIQLLDHFLIFCEDVKKNANPIPILPTTTSPPMPSFSEEGPPTETGSDSGSTEKEPSIDEPMPSPTGQPLG